MRSIWSTALWLPQCCSCHATCCTTKELCLLDSLHLLVCRCQTQWMQTTRRRRRRVSSAWASHLIG